MFLKVPILNRQDKDKWFSGEVWSIITTRLVKYKYRPHRSTSLMTSQSFKLLGVTPSTFDSYCRWMAQLAVTFARRTDISMTECNMIQDDRRSKLTSKCAKWECKDVTNMTVDGLKVVQTEHQNIIHRSPTRRIPTLLTQKPKRNNICIPKQLTSCFRIRTLFETTTQRPRLILQGENEATHLPE